MWQIRLLSGPQAGTTFPLKEGVNKIGRLTSLDISIQHASISKEHAAIEVRPDKVVIVDLGSRNGTFVNGVQIKKQTLEAGDKFALHDLFFEFIPLASNVRSLSPRAKSSGKSLREQAALAYQGNLAADMSEHSAPVSESVVSAKPTNSIDFIKRYFEEVVMPGVYHLASAMEYKAVFLLFCLINVVVTTMLSTIPLTRILSQRIAGESMQRAKSLAAALAESNRGAVQQGLITGIHTSILNGESGVTDAFVINIEGRILAPTSRAQEIPNIPYVHEVRRTGVEDAKRTSSTEIVAMRPIMGINPQTGLSAALAYAVVVYDMSRFAVSDGETFSLFVQSLFIALVIGGLAFYFLYRLTLRPITIMNAQVSAALRTGGGHVQVDYNYAELQELIGNINSALSRSLSTPTEAVNNFEYDRTAELTNLLNLVGFAAIAIRPDDSRVLGINNAFNEQIARGANWNGITLSEVLDTSLKQNLMGVMERATGTLEQIASDAIDINGINYDIHGQSVYGAKAIAYVMVVFVPRMGG
jgi:pSer/pThr/pTyr-binding forkhead associated (FHA) protein